MRPDELRRIAEGLGREPTTVELYAFDAQWSEHCSYKSSRHLLKQLPTTGPNVVLGPGEDAGILHLGEHNGERYGIVIAHESHNHPSQVVPFEGAATGVGGIVRDVLCMGAEVIALADCLRFGNVDDPQSHQRHVAQQVVDGIAAYGNAIGVPNIAGDVYFDEGFNDNCLVNVIALGLVKENEIIHSRAPERSAGWDIVLVGKATDASGFGGASFSSVTLEENNQEANKSAVQVPDPFLKNVIMRASYRVFEYLREKKITAGFKDLGAGGIMGCTAELCAAGGYGAIIDLDDVNVAVENLPPEVIAVGETQERLCWVLPGDVTADVLRIYNKEFSLPEIARGARAIVIGAVQAEKRYVMRHGSEIVMDVPIEFLTKTIPPDVRLLEQSGASAIGQKKPHTGPERVEEYDLESLLPRVLAHPNVCSREPLYKQYDSVVRGTTVIPRGQADAGVIAPIPGSPLGAALGVAGNPRLGNMNPFLAAQNAVLSAVYKVVSVGARPIGLSDCLNFGNPNNPQQYHDLVRATEGLAEAARELSLPFVSGNVSLYNESLSEFPIPASPIIACVGSLCDVKRVVTSELKANDSILYFVGNAQNALGGSVASELLSVRQRLPQVDWAAERRRIRFLLEVMEAGIVLSARAVSDGGLLTATARMLGRDICAGGIDFGCADLVTPSNIGDVELWFAEIPGVLIELPTTALGWDAEAAPFYEAWKANELQPYELFEVGRLLSGKYDSGFANLPSRDGDLCWQFDSLRGYLRGPLAEIYT